MICGEVIADVGSDHAYLPIWLYLNQKIKKAYALDISENCVTKIKINLKKYNVPEDIVIPVLSDGLSCFDSEYDFNELTDIIIAGIGGNNISKIIEKIYETKNIKNINFIFQPSGKIEILREYLYKNKFDIIQEIIITNENEKRIYNIINAKVTNKTYKPKPIEIIIGKNVNHQGYINKTIKHLVNILKDLNKSGDKKYNIKTDFGYYKDIENLISELELRKS